MEYGRLVVLGYSSYRVAMAKSSSISSSHIDGNTCRSPVGAIGTPESRKAEKDRRVIGQMWEPIGDQNAQYVLAKRSAANGVTLHRFHHFIDKSLRQQTHDNNNNASDDNLASVSASASITMTRSLSSTSSTSTTSNTSVKSDLKASTRRMMHVVELSHKKDLKASPSSSSYLMCVPMNDVDPHATITEYTDDATTDMFQIGRMPCKQNDVVIPGPRVGASGTISRFAARLLCSRDAPSECRIFAGGFDASNRMTTAGHALKRCGSCGQWLKRLPADHACVDKLVDNEPSEYFGKEFDHHVADIKDPEQLPFDGLTKNGVRVWLPEQRQWFEVSVNGNLYAIAPRTASPAASSSSSRRSSSNPDTSVRHSAFNRPTEGVAGIPAMLTNGAIIDLGGVQLQFQSTWSNQTSEEDSLLRASMSVFGDLDNHERPTELGDSSAASKLDKMNVHCPVQLHPLRFRRSNSDDDRVDADQVPHVFPACGHVFGYEKRIARSKVCPLCRHPGNFVPLLLKENFQLMSRAERNAVPECVFNPCGHAISNSLAAHYAGLLMPNGRAICPFCAVHLDSETPYSRLYLYSEATDRDSSVEVTATSL